MEVDLVWGNGPLGITLESGKWDSPVVVGIIGNGYAAQTKCIDIGFHLVGVNHKDISHLTFDSAMHYLLNCKRPVTLRFRSTCHSTKDIKLRRVHEKQSHSTHVQHRHHHHHHHHHRKPSSSPSPSSLTSHSPPLENFVHRINDKLPHHHDHQSRLEKVRIQKENQGRLIKDNPSSFHPTTSNTTRSNTTSLTSSHPTMTVSRSHSNFTSTVSSRKQSNYNTTTVSRNHNNFTNMSSRNHNVSSRTHNNLSNVSSRTPNNLISQPKLENQQQKLENQQQKLENQQQKLENQQPNLENQQPKLENQQQKLEKRIALHDPKVHETIHNVQVNRTKHVKETSRLQQGKVRNPVERNQIIADLDSRSFKPMLDLNQECHRNHMTTSSRRKKVVPRDDFDDSPVITVPHNPIPSCTGVPGAGFYDLVWTGGNLGIKFRRYERDPNIPSIAEIERENNMVFGIEYARPSDLLVDVNGQGTRSIGYKATLSLLQNMRRPSVLRFIYYRRNSNRKEPQTQSDIANPSYYFHQQMELLDNSNTLSHSNSSCRSSSSSSVLNPKNPCNDNTIANDPINPINPISENHGNRINVDPSLQHVAVHDHNFNKTISPVKHKHIEENNGFIGSDTTKRLEVNEVVFSTVVNQKNDGTSKLSSTTTSSTPTISSTTTISSTPQSTTLSTPTPTSPTKSTSITSPDSLNPKPQNSHTIQPKFNSQSHCSSTTKRSIVRGDSFTMLTTEGMNPSTQSDDIKKNTLEKEPFIYDVIWEMGKIGFTLKSNSSHPLGVPVVSRKTKYGHSIGLQNVESGDELIALNGVFFCGETYEEKLTKIKTASKPMHFKFRRATKNDAETMSTDTSLLMSALDKNENDNKHEIDENMIHNQIHNKNDNDKEKTFLLYNSISSYDTPLLSTSDSSYDTPLLSTSVSSYDTPLLSTSTSSYDTPLLSTYSSSYDTPPLSPYKASYDTSSFSTSNSSCDTSYTTQINSIFSGTSYGNSKRKSKMTSYGYSYGNSYGNSYGSSIIENESSIIENESSVIENGDSIIENGNSIIENESSNIENESSNIENENYVMENENYVMENENSVIENENSVMENESSISENESSMIENESSMIENESSMIENGSSMIENGNSIIEKCNEISNGIEPIESNSFALDQVCSKNGKSNTHYCATDNPIGDDISMSMIDQSLLNDIRNSFVERASLWTDDILKAYEEEEKRLIKLMESDPTRINECQNLISSSSIDSVQAPLPVTTVTF